MFLFFINTAKKPGLAVYGADARIPEINYVCKDLEDFKLGSLDVTPLHTPCHTKGHVCFYVVDPTTCEKAVFTGDTLFVGGIGNFFEGDARDMYRNIFHSIAKLPEETWFALTIEPNNEALIAKWNWIQDKMITVPSTIGQEKLFNPYLRVNEQSLQLMVGKSDPVEALNTLREMQNNFR
ncbi:hypothetical protein G6F56_012552 [Rhizopus delemar]|nr:hypothetical protein G6F56_012552 [Rhizopus delemar]